MEHDGAESADTAAANESATVRKDDIDETMVCKVEYVCGDGMKG